MLSSAFLVDDMCEFDKLDEDTNNSSSELEAEFLVCLRLSMYQKQEIKSLSPIDQIN